MTAGKTQGRHYAGASVPRIRVGVMLAPIEFGGVERICLTLLKEMGPRQVEVVPVLFTRPWEPNNAFVIAAKKMGLKVHEIPIARREHGDVLRIARCFYLAYRVIREEGVTVLHTHGYFADIVGLSVARVLGIPSVSTSHGFIKNTWKFRLYNWVDRIALRSANTVIAVSKELREELLALGLNSTKVRVIENAVVSGLEVEWRESAKREERIGKAIDCGEFVIGFVGRLSEEKGLTYLLDAGGQLAKAKRRIRIVIVGVGPQEEELRTHAKSLGIEGLVIFAGFQAEVRRWLLCFDAFVLPSLTEGTPVALLEAMACGVPVVATAVGGVPSVLSSGAAGIMVPPKDADEIRKALELIADDQDKRQSFIKEAIALIREKYNIETWIRTHEALYRAVGRDRIRRTPR